MEATWWDVVGWCNLRFDAAKWGLIILVTLGLHAVERAVVGYFISGLDVVKWVVVGSGTAVLFAAHCVSVALYIASLDAADWAVVCWCITRFGAADWAGAAKVAMGCFSSGLDVFGWVVLG